MNVHSDFTQLLNSGQFKESVFGTSFASVNSRVKGRGDDRILTNCWDDEGFLNVGEDRTEITVMFHDLKYSRFETITTKPESL